MRWKWIGLGAALLAVALVVAGYAVLMSYDWNSLKPVVAEQVKEATGRELTLQGDIKLAVGLRPTLEVGGVSLANAEWGSRPQMIKVQRVEAKVALLPLLSGQVEVDRLVLVEPDILVESGPQGRLNLAMAPPEPGGGGGDKPAAGNESPGPAQAGGGQEDIRLPGLWFREVAITDGKLAYRGPDGGDQRVLALQSLQAKAAEPDSPIKLELEGSLDGQPLALSGRTGSLRGLNAGDWPVDLQGRVLGVELAVEGKLARPLAGRGLDLQIKASGQDLAAVAPGAGLSGPFSLEGRLTDPEPQAYKLAEMELSAAGSRLSGWVQAGLAGARPAVTARLDSPKLDLGPFLQGGGGQAAGAKGGGERVFPSDPLPLDALRAVDADVELKAAEVLLAGVRPTEVELKLGLKDGRLAIKPLNAKLAGGELKAALDLRPGGQGAAAALDLAARGVAVEELLAQAGAGRILEGPLELLVDVQGRGASVAEILATLDGKLAALVQDGRINNRYLELLGGNLLAVLGNLAEPGSLSKDYTPMNCLILGFKSQDGLAETTALLLNTTNMVVLGEGRVNLRNEALELAFQPSPKKSLTQAATGGTMSLSLAQMSRPFKLGGTLAEPEVTLDEKQIISTLAKAAGGFAALGPAGAAAAALTAEDVGQEAGCEPAAESVRKGVKFKPQPAAAAPSGQAGQAGQEPSGGSQDMKKQVEEGLKRLKSLFE